MSPQSCAILPDDVNIVQKLPLNSLKYQDIHIFHLRELKGLSQVRVRLVLQQRRVQNIKLILTCVSGLFDGEPCSLQMTLNIELSLPLWRGVISLSDVVTLTCRTSVMPLGHRLRGQIGQRVLLREPHLLVIWRPLLLISEILIRVRNNIQILPEALVVLLQILIILVGARDQAGPLILPHILIIFTSQIIILRWYLIQIPFILSV